MALFQPNDQVQQHFKFEGWLRVYEGLVSQLPHPAGSKSKPSKKFLNELKWHDGYCVARMDERSLICYANEQVAHLFDRHLSSVRLDLGRPEILDTSTDSNSNYSVVSSSMSMCSFGYATVDRAFTTNSKYYGKGMMAETETIRRKKHKKNLWERRFAYSTLRTIKADRSAKKKRPTSSTRTRHALRGEDYAAGAEDALNTERTVIVNVDVAALQMNRQQQQQTSSGFFFRLCFLVLFSRILSNFLLKENGEILYSIS